MYIPSAKKSKIANCCVYMTAFSISVTNNFHLNDQLRGFKVIGK